MFDWFYGLDMPVLYPLTIILIVGAAELGNWIGLRLHAARTENADVGTLAGASLGLLALLIAFSFSMAESRYDLRRNMVLEEANAIGSTANFALMLPEDLRRSRSSVCCATIPRSGSRSGFRTIHRRWNRT